MFGKVRFLCLNILIIFGSITSIQGGCEIHLPNNATKPNLYRIVGSRKMELNAKPTISFENVDYVEFHENQVIQAQCDLKFQLITDFDNEQLEKWIALSKYEHDLVIMHSKLYSSLNLHLLPLIESVWWPNLRLHNWKNYVTALEQHVESENQTYDILAGVSGAIKVPIIEDCQTNYTLKEVSYEMERKIPLYVWNYIQARDNSSNGIVIIGINSPFQELYSAEEIVFCPDKCQEIPWLKEVSSTFRYRIMGTIFCCNVEDVKSSKHLDGFPENDMQSIPAETSFILNHVPLTEYNYNDNSDDYNAED
ncbi:uncharacterized protein LOC135950471 [Calliphora vicina]|uniref:uncharacterized protein LOC135950471 n=1 Tax=Calliphora vicina TaxID=7373 RepID=UPI00325B7CB9